MKNINFLQDIHCEIVRRLTDNRYYAYVGAIYGYDDEHNYENGLSFLIDENLINDEYDVESIIMSKDETNEYVSILSFDEIDRNVNIDFSKLKVKNDMISYVYSEDELNAFCSTFMFVIKQLANYENDNINTTKNQIYKRVIEFYYNFGNDEVLSSLNIILKSVNYNTTTQSITTCGCNSSSQSSSLTSTEDCPTSYQNAMELYLIQMLGDTEFYYDFFHENGEPIEDLIDSLINLIEEFKSLNYDLSFSDNKSHCGCPQLSKDNGSCNYNILDNYIRILNWIKNCEIEENINKIKIYGEQFGELLTKLLF